MTATAKNTWRDRAKNPLIAQATLREACRVLGHIERPIYTEEDGHTDDYYCTRCGIQL